MASLFHSADLQWQLLRPGHSFLVKRNGISLSAEPLNLTNTHSFKFSGLANPRAVGVDFASNGKRVQLQIRNGKKANLSRPSKATQSVMLQKHFRSGSSRGARTISALTSGSAVRADLTPFAIARYHKLRKATTGVAGKKQARRAARKTVA